MSRYHRRWGDAEYAFRLSCSVSSLVVAGAFVMAFIVAGSALWVVFRAAVVAGYGIQECASHIMLAYRGSP